MTDSLLHNPLTVVGLLKDADELRDFLADLLTPDELLRLDQRWRIMTLTVKGFSVREVHEQTGASPATIARVRRVVKHGTGIVPILIDRLDQAEEHTADSG